MSKSEVPAVLFGGSSVLAMGLARSLARNGVVVYYVTSMKSEAAFSRYFKQCFIVPDLETNLEKQTDFLVGFQNRCSLAVIFPGGDLPCLNLASIRTKLDRRTSEKLHFLLPKKEIVDTLLNKKRFYQSLSKQNILHPLTYFPENSDDVARISHEVEYPVYLKPCFMHIFATIFKIKGFVAKSKEELKWYYNLAAKHNVDVMIQEFIPGPDNHIYGINAYINEKNNPRGLFAYRRIRGFPRDFGYGSLIESVALSSIPETEIVIKYLHELGYHGLADAEFKLDSRDGKFKFLEVNPRVWLQSSFPAKCGLNLNLIAYLDATNGPVSLNGNYKIGLKWIDPLSDLVSSLNMFKNRELPISEWISSLRMIKDSACSPSDDLFPCILHPFFSLREKLQRSLSQRNNAPS